MIQTAKREPLNFFPNSQIVNASNSTLSAVVAAAVACGLAGGDLEAAAAGY